MPSSSAPAGSGRALAERLGLKIIGVEGHDLKCGCRFCGSSDAGRLHADTGAYSCYSCRKGTSGFDLTKIVLGDHKAAIQTMIDVGLFQPYMRDGNGQPLSPAATPAAGNTKAGVESECDLLTKVAGAKGCTADGFRRFGAVVKRDRVLFPMRDENGKVCSGFWMSVNELKGKNLRNGSDIGGGRKASGVGLFLPGCKPEPGEMWLLVEGVKDAAALSDLGYNAAGLPGNSLNARFAPMFDGCDLILIPDADEASWKGVKSTTDALTGHAKSIRIAKLLVEIKPSHGADVRDVLRDQGEAAIRRAIDEAKLATEKAERFPLVTSPALDSEDYTARPIITEVLFEGSPAIIGGMFKTGKTLLAIDAAISISAGRPFIGAYTVPEPRGVVYFTGEGGPAVAQEYGRRIARSKGIELADATQLHWCFSVPRLEDVRDLDAFAKVLDDTDTQVIILDNLMLAISGDNLNVYSMGSVLGNVVRICSERGVTPILVHHFKRTRATADPFAPGELTDLTQAGVAEIAGQWLLLARRRAYNPADPGRHELWLTLGGRIGHSSLAALDVSEGSRADPGGRRWEVDVLRPEDVQQQTTDAKQEQRAAKKAEELEADRRLVVQAAVKWGKPDTMSGLRDRTPIPHKRFPAAFASLADDGTLQSAAVVKANGQTYDGWEVRNDE